MAKTAKLAIHGGKPAKTGPYGKGVRFGAAEEEAVVAVVRSQKLWCKQGGTRVPALEQAIGRMWDVPHAVGCSSGTAAVHAAVIMCGVEAGDEVILNPITDWGSICGVLAAGAVPVFADIREDTFSLDPASVAERITARARAILVVHMAGYPAHVQEMVALAKPRGIKVIEDCAQAALARIGGRAVGTFGDVGAFSTNDSKHISCGEGGFVITADGEMARVARRFIDKGYEPNKARGQTDVRFLGFNYRMSEVEASLLTVQLAGLEAQIARRGECAQRLTAGLTGIPGLQVMQPRPGTQPAWWAVLARLEPEVLSADRATIGAALAAEGLAVWCALAPAGSLYQTTALQEKRLYPQGRTAPAAFLAGRSYGPGLCPVADRISTTALSFMASPFYTAEDAEETVTGVRRVLAYYHR